MSYTTRQRTSHVVISREAPQELDGSGWRTGDFSIYVPIDEWDLFRCTVATADKKLAATLEERRREIDTELEALSDRGVWYSASAREALREAFEKTPEEHWERLREAVAAMRDEEEGCK